MSRPLRRVLATERATRASLGAELRRPGARSRDPVATWSAAVKP